jgi:DNA-binding NtrC family response regulator
LKPQILVVDDDEGILQSCETILEDEGFEVTLASSAAAAITALDKRSFDVALIDLRLPGSDGLDVLKQALVIDPELVAIIFTAHGSIETAVEAVKLGAFNYVTKPFTAGQLLAVLNKAVEHRRLISKNRALQHQLESCCRFGGIVGQSARLQAALKAVSKVAPFDANVLVLGESGTGKELISRAVHVHSGRRNGPFIAVDCAALPAALLESELFGHEKGAFTGAAQAKRGLLELANGGTVFFDEIGEMTLELQAKLLRTLQEHSFRRLGGERLTNVDVRVIASTNRDLEAEAQKGTFRQDLLFRLNVVTIVLPPLREREGDVRLLAMEFLQTFCRAAARPVVELAPESLRLLEAYSWPGNVRELRNVIERAVVFCDGRSIQPRDLPEFISHPKPSSPAAAAAEPASGFKAVREQWVETQGKQYLNDLLRRHNGNISAAAREAQISRKSLYDLLHRYRVQQS